MEWIFGILLIVFLICVIFKIRKNKENPQLTELQNTTDNIPQGYVSEDEFEKEKEAFSDYNKFMDSREQK